MAATTRIDEINTPQSFDAEQFIREYFKPMRISKERKEIREEAARDFRDFLLFILALIATESAYNVLNWAYIEEQFRREFERAALEYARRSQELEDYIAEKASDFVRVTQQKDLSDPYWTSDERATMEAVNEANDVVGYEELQQAIEDGYTHKIWKTENDSRVRKTHRAVEGKKIPIKDMFEVGDGLMRYPHDWYYNAMECYNCRCALVFTDKDGKVNKTSEKVQYTNEENSGTINNKNTNYAKPIEELTKYDKNSFYADITPESIYENMRTSSVGQEALEYYQNNEAEITFVNGFGREGERASQQGRYVKVYLAKINSNRVGAQTLVHEYVHMRYGIGQCQKAEAICMAYEKMHIMGRNWITKDEWDYVCRLAREHYPEYPWENYRYGEYEQFDFIKG